MIGQVLELSKQLICIPGYAELPEKETKVAMALHEEMMRLRLTATLEDFGGRYNVRCSYKGDPKGKKVVLCTHLDTVPQYEMKDAFSPVVKDGRLYGRGSVDVRDILAAMTMVMVRLEQERPAGVGDVTFLAVADEESGSAGMRYAVRQGIQSNLVIVGEPTELALGIAHKGVAWLELEFQGKAAHGSVPDDGHNAVYDAVRAISRIEQQLLPVIRQREHPVLGTGTLNVGRVDGGTRPTIVPDHCIVQIDRRLLPGESAESAVEELKAVLQQLKQEDPAVLAKINVLLGSNDKPFPPLAPLNDEVLLSALCDAVSSVTAEPASKKGLSYWTDGALSSHLAGIPTVVLGPGSIVQAHSNHEYVEIAQLEQAEKIYYQMILAVSSKV